MVVLLKSSDKVISDPRSYRGICLLPVLGKVLERVLVSRLQEMMMMIGDEDDDSNCADQVEVERGCPQGSVGGPQFWNIKIDQLLHQLSVTCRFSAFADD